MCFHMKESAGFWMRADWIAWILRKETQVGVEWSAYMFRVSLVAKFYESFYMVSVVYICVYR